MSPTESYYRPSGPAIRYDMTYLADQIIMGGKTKSPWTTAAYFKRIGRKVFLATFASLLALQLLIRFGLAFTAKTSAGSIFFQPAFLFPAMMVFSVPLWLAAFWLALNRSITSWRLGLVAGATAAGHSIESLIFPLARAMLWGGVLAVSFEKIFYYTTLISFDPNGVNHLSWFKSAFGSYFWLGWIAATGFLFMVPLMAFFSWMTLCAFVMSEDMTNFVFLWVSWVLEFSIMISFVLAFLAVLALLFGEIGLLIMSIIGLFVGPLAFFKALEVLNRRILDRLRAFEKGQFEAGRAEPAMP